TTQRLTFTLDETSGIALIKPQALRNWVVNGRVKPTIYGSKGGGHHHRFNAQTVLGIVVAVGLIRSPGGCTRAYADRMIRLFSEMSDEALLCFLGARDTWTEEDYAKWRRGPAFPTATTAEDKEGVDEFLERVNRAKDMIRARMVQEGAG